MKKTLGAILVPFLGASAGIVGCLMTLPFLVVGVGPLVGTLVGVVWLFYLGAWKTSLGVLFVFFYGRLVLEIFLGLGAALIDIRNRVLAKANPGEVELFLSSGFHVLGSAAVAVPCASWALGVFWLFNWLASRQGGDVQTPYLLASLGAAIVPWIDWQNRWHGTEPAQVGVLLGYATAVGLALTGMDHRISEWTIIGFMVVAFLVMVLKQAPASETRDREKLRRTLKPYTDELPDSMAGNCYGVPELTMEEARAIDAELEVLETDYLRKWDEDELPEANAESPGNLPPSPRTPGKDSDT